MGPPNGWDMEVGPRTPPKNSGRHLVKVLF